MTAENDTSFEDPRIALKRHGLFPKHSFGQNFLVSQKAVSTIASACVALYPRVVVEIGAGVGTLTAALLREGASVIAVERDRDMCHVLKTDFAGRKNFVLMEEDAAKLDYRALLGEHKGVIAGNLPYQITGRLLRAAVETYDRLVRAVLMVQEEVANRLVALPKTSSRGALSVIVQSRFAIKIVLRLKPTAFHPPPKVRSAVLVFDPLPTPIFLPGTDPTQFDALVNAAFSSRRKTIRNSLASGIRLPVAIVESLLENARIVSSMRPEELSIQDFARLSDTAVNMGLL